MRTPTAGTVGLRTDPSGRVATIAIDRGTHHHALTLELLTELEARIIQVANTPAQVVILRTPRTKANYDDTNLTSDPQPPTVDKWRKWIPIGHRVFKQLADLKQPTIAVVDGLSVGSGAELAMACGFRLTTDRARIGPTQVGLGTIPGWGGTERLTQLIGAVRARKLIRAARQLDATTAQTWGLITSSAPAQDLEQHVAQLVDRLLATSHVAQQINDQLINSTPTFSAN